MCLGSGSVTFGRDKHLFMLMSWNLYIAFLLDWCGKVLKWCSVIYNEAPACRIRDRRGTVGLKLFIYLFIYYQLYIKRQDGTRMRNEFKCTIDGQPRLKKTQLTGVDRTRICFSIQPAFSNMPRWINPTQYCTRDLSEGTFTWGQSKTNNRKWFYHTVRCHIFPRSRGTYEWNIRLKTGTHFCTN